MGVSWSGMPKKGLGWTLVTKRQSKKRHKLFVKDNQSSGSKWSNLDKSPKTEVFDLTMESTIQGATQLLAF
jgi:hypothetical protein